VYKYCVCVSQDRQSEWKKGEIRRNSGAKKQRHFSTRFLSVYNDGLISRPDIVRKLIHLLLCRNLERKSAMRRRWKLRSSCFSLRQDIESKKMSGHLILALLVLFVRMQHQYSCSSRICTRWIDTGCSNKFWKGIWQKKIFKCHESDQKIRESLFALYLSSIWRNEFPAA